MNLEPYESFAHELAELSASVILPYYGRKDIGLEQKGDDTPVTKADRDAEAAMRDAILKKFPNHGVIGEEHGNENPDAEFTWVLDPIDGTKSFISNVPLFGTLIALLYQGKPVLGVINQPILKQLCIGNRSSCTMNGQAIQFRKTLSLDRAVLLCSDATVKPEYQNPEGWDKLDDATYLRRTWGDCYGYLLTASGWADIMADPILEVWDIAAIIPIIEGAGGRITNWQGEDAWSHGRKHYSAIAAHPELHQEVIDILNHEQ